MRVHKLDARFTSAQARINRTRICLATKHMPVQARVGLHCFCGCFSLLDNPPHLPPASALFVFRGTVRVGRRRGPQHCLLTLFLLVC